VVAELVRDADALHPRCFFPLKDGAPSSLDPKVTEIISFLNILPTPTANSVYEVLQVVVGTGPHHLQPPLRGRIPGLSTHGRAKGTTMAHRTGGDLFRVLKLNVPYSWPRGARLPDHRAPRICSYSSADGHVCLAYIGEALRY
jgi:hypothetical protein